MLFLLELCSKLCMYHHAQFINPPLNTLLDWHSTYLDVLWILSLSRVSSSCATLLKPPVLWRCNCANTSIYMCQSEFRLADCICAIPKFFRSDWPPIFELESGVKIREILSHPFFLEGKISRVGISQSLSVGKSGDNHICQRIYRFQISETPS